MADYIGLINALRAQDMQPKVANGGALSGLPSELRKNQNALNGPVTANLGILAQGLRSRTAREYPYMRGALSNMALSYTPDSGDSRMLEYWPAGETGAGGYERPANLPISKVGVQVLSSLTKPKDLLADYVSHEGVNKDRKLSELYGQFQGAVPDETMRRRYAEHQSQFGESRPYEQWLSQTGMPELLRGYTFDQWPNAERMYTPEQLSILDKIRGHVGVNK